MNRSISDGTPTKMTSNKESSMEALAKKEDTKRQIIWAVVATVIATVLIVCVTVGTIHGHTHPPASRCLDGTVLVESVAGGWGCVPK